ncbi:homospermidine synthase [Paramecium bursaria Chlorella virus CviKI]|nr:homospermidine synthase [Paramecium bursaria Chlorella virus CviKI]
MNAKKSNRDVNVNSNGANSNVKNNRFVNANKLNFSVDLGDRRILQVGCGGVGASMPPLYKRHLKFSSGNVIIIDKNRTKIDKFAEKYPTMKFINTEVTKNNYKNIIDQYLKKGDVFVDLAWYMNTKDLLRYCHEKGIHFVNTAIESWYGEEDCKAKTKECETLYRHQHDVRELAKSWGNKGPTAVVGHGANPGWVSHAMKIGIQDWVDYLSKKNSSDSNVKKAKEWLAKGKYNEAAKLLNIQVIHISERDTQITNDPKKVGEFVNTWSPTGLIEEGSLPAELGWGTHETMKQYVKHFSKGPGNEVYIPKSMAMNTTVKSVVPSGEIVGCVIPHEEANSISYFLTTTKGGKATYRPTVHYAYMLPDVAIASLQEYQADGCPDFLKKERVLKDDIISGKDELGVLMMSPKYGKWWTGSLLDIETSRKLVPHQSATIVQVSASVLAAIIYALKYSNLGPIFPEDMDSDWIMKKLIMPYLGEWRSAKIVWEPSLSNVPKKYHKTKDLIFEKFLINPPVME